MEKQLERTRVTSLSDAELLILDMAATLGGCRRMYALDVFPLQFNYPSHELDDDVVARTLDRFEAEGWIAGEDFTDQWGQPDRYVYVTAIGGHLWESERHPDWSRFVTDWYGPTRRDSERHRVSIFGHSRLICQAFFDAGRQCGFLDYRGGAIATGAASRQLIYWRPEQTVYLLSAWVESWHSATDWQHFEMKRCWWRFPDEIGKLWGWPPATESET